MTLNTSSKSTYQPPNPGSYSAVCIGVIDVGTMTGPFGSQPKVYLQFELGELNPIGDRYVIGRLYTNSITPKAKLREHLESWRGRKFTDEELTGFDLTTILEKPCLLTVGNTRKGDRSAAFFRYFRLRPASVSFSR